MVGETDPNEIYIEGKPINASHEGIKNYFQMTKTI